MIKYYILFSIIFFVGCTSSSTESANPTSKVEQTKPVKQKIPATEVSEKAPTTNDQLSTDRINEKPTQEKQPTVVKSKVETPKEVANVSTPAPSKKETAKVVTPAPAKEKVSPPPPKPVVEAPKPTIEKIDKVEKVEAPKPEPVKVEKVEAPKKISSVNHSVFDGLLRKYVSATGKVNYKGLKSAESTLNQYLGLLEKIKVGDLNGKNEKMAFWINAYNAYTLKLILKNYPLKSITDLHGGKPWDVKWIKLDGRNLSLNNIENDILRPTYKDPRIHFAVNCAAKSCPSLLNKAWTSGNLESSFVTQTKKFINNSDFNKISKKKVEISKIFDWYKVDFGNLVNFLNKYSSTEIKSDAKIEFVEYDWSLNQ